WQSSNSEGFCRLSPLTHVTDNLQISRAFWARASVGRPVAHDPFINSVLRCGRDRVSTSSPFAGVRPPTGFGGGLTSAPGNPRRSSETAKTAKVGHTQGESRQK